MSNHMSKVIFSSPNGHCVAHACSGSISDCQLQVTPSEPKVTFFLVNLFPDLVYWELFQISCYNWNKHQSTFAYTLNERVIWRTTTKSSWNGMHNPKLDSYSDTSLNDLRLHSWIVQIAILDRFARKQLERKIGFPFAKSGLSLAKRNTA